MYKNKISDLLDIISALLPQAVMNTVTIDRHGRKYCHFCGWRHKYNNKHDEKCVIGCSEAVLKYGLEEEGTGVI